MLRDYFPMYRQTQIETLFGYSLGIVGALSAFLLIILGPHNPACQMLAACGSGVSSMSLMLSASNLRSTVGMYHKTYVASLCAVLSFVTCNCQFAVYSTVHPYGFVGYLSFWSIAVSFFIQIPMLGKWLRYFITEPAPRRPIHFL